MDNWKENFNDWYINISGQNYLPSNMIEEWIEKNIMGKATKIQQAAKAVLSETMYFETGEEGEHFEDSETYKKLEHLVNGYDLPNVIEER